MIPKHDSHDISAFLGGYPEWSVYLKKYLDINALAHSQKLKPVQFHKKYLPSISYRGTYYNGEFKFWTWEIGLLTIYVSNLKGVCIEMEAAPYQWWTAKEALEEFEFYFNKIVSAARGSK